MADLQRIDPQIVTQPQPAQIPMLAATEAAHNAETLQRAIPAVTDQIYQAVDKYYADKASTDAAQAIQYDGAGNIIPPASFKPPGWNFNSYRQNYEATYKSLYFDAARSEYDNYRQGVVAKYPGDPAKVTELLTAKKETMLGAMGAEYRPLMAVSFNAMSAQAITGVANNVENQNHQALVAKADRAMVDFAGQMARSAQWDAAARSPNAQNDAGLDEQSMRATAAYFKADWDNRIKPLLRQSGASDATIDTYFDKTLAKSIVFRARGHFSKLDLLYPPGHERAGMPDPLKEVEMNRFIRAIAVGPFSQEIEQGARMGADEARAIANSYGQARRSDDEDSILGRHRAMQQQVYAMAGDPLISAQGPEASRKMIESMYRDERTRMLFDGRMNSANTMKSLALLDQTHNVQTAENQRYFGNQVVTLAQNMSNSQLTPSQNTEAKNQLEQAIADPDITRLMTPAVMSHAQQAIGHFYRAKAQSDVAGVRMDLRMGKIDDEHVLPVIQALTDRGYAGDTPAAVTSLAQLTEDAAIGAKVRAEKKRIADYSAQALNTAQAGGFPTAEQAKAYSISHPLTVTDAKGNKVPFNLMENGHVATAVADFNTSHVLDPAVKTSIENTPWAGSPQAAANLGMLYSGLASVIQNTAPPGKNAGAHGKLVEMMGEQAADFGRMVKREGNPEAAMKAWAARSTSTAGNAGEGTQKIVDQANASIDRELNDPENSYLLQSNIVGKSITPNVSDIDKTLNRLAEKSGTATTYLGFGASGFKSFVIEDSGIRSELTDRMSARVVGAGDLNQKVTGERWKDAFEVALRQSEGGLEMVPHPSKPGVGLIQRLSTRSLAAQILQQPIDMVSNADAGRLAAVLGSSYLKIYGSELDTPVDAATAKMEMTVSDTGSKIVRVTDMIGGFKPVFGPRYGGQERVLFELPVDHEIFSIGGRLKEFANMHIRNIVGPDASPELLALGNTVATAYSAELAQHAVSFKEWAQVKMFRQSFEMLQVDKQLRAAAGDPDYIQDPTKLFTRISNMPKSQVIEQWQDKLKTQNEDQRRQRIELQQGLMLNKALRESGESGMWLPIYMGHKITKPPGVLGQPPARP